MGDDDTDEILVRPIGVDAAGCVYGDSVDALGRMAPFGRLDWLSRSVVLLSRRDMV
jgi:hypothetical protein